MLVTNNVETTRPDALSAMELEELALYTKSEIPAITPEMIEGLRSLDEIGAALQERYFVSDIVEIVGVVAGIKPAAMISSLDTPERKSIQEILPSLGLKEITVPGQISYISRHPELVRELADTQSEFHRLARSGQASRGDEQMNALEAKIGMLEGFPQTATDHYLERATKSYSGQDSSPYIPPEGYESFSPYMQFVISPHYAKEEINAYVIPLANAVSILTPRTYSHYEQMHADE